MTHEQEGNNGMSELPKVAELDIPYTAEERAARIATQSVERAILNTVEISLWVRGREIRTVVDDETLHRIMAILTGGL